MYNRELKAGMIVECNDGAIVFKAKVINVNEPDAYVDEIETHEGYRNWNIVRRANGEWGGNCGGGELTLIKGVALNLKKLYERTKNDKRKERP